jgi:hypothetical protein
VEFVALEMVPTTVEAHLHDVARELVVAAVELGQLRRRRDTGAVGLAEAVAVDVGDEA